jgi:hypothetical protein
VASEEDPPSGGSGFGKGPDKDPFKDKGAEPEKPAYPWETPTYPWETPGPGEPPKGESLKDASFKDFKDEPRESSPEGSMTFQDAATAKPRPPKPAEVRARQKFAKKQQEIEEARLAAEAKRKKRNRTLIGAGAAVGVVGVVAGLGYWALSAPTVYAQCAREDVNGQPVIVPDNYCTGHTGGLNGFFFYGGHQYRYYYGSSGSIGSRPTGGSTTAPSGSTVKTRSGTTISRGGLGGKFGGGGS